MSDVFVGNVAAQAGFDGILRAFVEPVVTVRQGVDAVFPVQVLVREVSEVGFPAEKEFLFTVEEDGLVLVQRDLDEDFTDVQMTVREHVREQADLLGFPFPQDWVLADELEEEDMERISTSVEGWFSPARP